MNDKPKTTPKDFFLWAGAMVSLYASVIAFITLLFGYIDYTFQDPLRYYVDPYMSGMPYQMAALIVLTPLLLVLMRIIRNAISHDATRADIWVRRWALYLTVFVAGVAVIVDLIILLTSFLSGAEITTAFILKVLVVLLVAGAGFLHFLSDIRGYWATNANRAKMVNYGVGVLVILVIVSGFFIVGTPRDARLARYDLEREQALQNIQWQLINFWQSKGRLPENLTELEDPISGFAVPLDPETNEAYTYTKNGARSFELCAVFNKETFSRNTSRIKSPYEDGNFDHGIGKECFPRTIDPDLYPVIPKAIR